MANCDLNNNAKGRGCQVYEGVIAGAFIKNVPFSYSEADINDIDAIKAELIAAADRLYIIKDKDDYELLQQREAQNGTTASGRQQYYGQTPHAFALHERKPRAYDIRSAIIDGAGTQKVYVMPFTNQGFINPNLLSDGEYHAKEYDLTKLLMEASDYTAGEKMLKYIFTEYSPLENTKYNASVKPTGYDPNALDGVEDIEITIVSASATQIVCTVNLAGESANNISTLVTANFNKVDGSGTTEAVTAAYSATTGQYTLTGVGMSSGTIYVNPVAADSIYYEGSAAVTVS